MLKHPRGHVSPKELKAIMTKLHKHKHIGFDKMKIVLMNEMNHKTGRYYTEDEASAIAGSIFQKQKHMKEMGEIKQEKK